MLGKKDSSLMQFILLLEFFHWQVSFLQIRIYSQSNAWKTRFKSDAFFSLVRVSKSLACQGIEAPTPICIGESVDTFFFLLLEFFQ